jgi:hypothetical protein
VSERMRVRASACSWRTMAWRSFCHGTYQDLSACERHLALIFASIAVSPMDFSASSFFPFYCFLFLFFSFLFAKIFCSIRPVHSIIRKIHNLEVFQCDFEMSVFYNYKCVSSMSGRMR